METNDVIIELLFYFILVPSSDMGSSFRMGMRIIYKLLLVLLRRLIFSLNNIGIKKDEGSLDSCSDKLPLVSPALECWSEAIIFLFIFFVIVDIEI